MSLDDTEKLAFRRALGSFATGVTIATTTDNNGMPVGVTASSFNSVSLDPPLVLWSLAKDARSLTAFSESGHFAVHVLTASQIHLSNRFAISGEDKFDGMDWCSGELGSPVFTDHAALFECRTRHQYDGGDHIIMVGEVVAYEARDEAPLLFHGGGYAERSPSAPGSSPGKSSGYFGKDSLFTLIAHANAHLSGGEMSVQQAKILECELAESFSDKDLTAARRILKSIVDLTTADGD